MTRTTKFDTAIDTLNRMDEISSFAVYDADKKGTTKKSWQLYTLVSYLATVLTIIGGLLWRLQPTYNLRGKTDTTATLDFKLDFINLCFVYMKLFFKLPFVRKYAHTVPYVSTSIFPCYVGT